MDVTAWNRAVARMLAVVGLVGSAGCGAAAAQAQGARPPASDPTGPVETEADVRLPDPSRGDPVTLRQMLAWAREHAPEPRVARSRRGLGRAAQAGARPLLPSNPEAEVQVGPRWRQDQSGLDVRGRLTQRVEIGGEPRARMRAAERTKDRFDAEVARARWSTHERVYAAFHRALVARERTRAQRQLLQFQDTLAALARERHEAGDIAELELRMAKAEVASARQRVIAAEQRERAARLQLAERAGWPIEHLPVPAGDLGPARRAQPVERLMRLALRHNPALYHQAGIIAESRARADAAARDGWPEPEVGVLAGREDPGGGQRAKFVRGIVSLPLPLWRRNQGERARTRAELDIAHARDRTLRETLRKRVARISSEVDSAAERIEVYSDEVLPQFERTLEMLGRAYELGESSIMEVSSARERLLRLQTEALGVYESYHDAVATLRAHVGTDTGLLRQAAARE